MHITINTNGIVHVHICDPLRDNPAHSTKIDFLLEAIIVTKVTF